MRAVHPAEDGDEPARSNSQCSSSPRPSRRPSTALASIAAKLESIESKLAAKENTEDSARLDVLTSVTSRLETIERRIAEREQGADERLGVLKSRMESLEATLVSAMQTLKAVAEQSGQQASRGRASFSDQATERFERSSANLKKMIAVAFEKFDVDKSGVLDRTELQSALRELTSDGDTVDAKVVSEYMRQYDRGRDASGTLDLDEFTSLVGDLAKSGRLEMKEVLREELKALAAARDDHPWVSCMRGDHQVQDIIRALRSACAGTTRRRLRDDEGLSTRSESSDGLPAIPDGYDDLHGQKPAGGGLCRKFCQLLSCLPMLRPDTRFASARALFVALLICWCAISVPLELAFEKSLHRSFGDSAWRAWEMSSLVIDSCFMLDIVLSFRTGFFVDGQLVRDGWRIAKRYLCGWFVVDLLGAFPLNLILRSSDEDSGGTRLNRNFRLLRVFFKLNRMLRLSKLSQQLKVVELMLSFNPSAIRLTKLFILMACCCHWIGCLCESVRPSSNARSLTLCRRPCRLAES